MTNIKELINPFKELNDTLKCVGNLAKELKLECYVVGGAVRDLFLQREISEIDIMVVGDGIRFAKELADRLHIKKVISFERFGTARLPRKNLPIEIASAREESYDSDSRKPDEIIYTDLKGDLLRRDFTINAMALDLLPRSFGNFFDPFGGVSDIKNKYSGKFS